MIMLCSFTVTASADTIIEYALGGGWIYEEGHPNTLLLTDNSPDGVTATINVPSGIENGGLTASRHSLLGFSPINYGFIELQYSSLSSTVIGNAAYLDLNLELEFFDSDSNSYQIRMNISQSAEAAYFESWFEKDSEIDLSVDALVPDTIMTNQGALGLYLSDGFLNPYFKDMDGNQTFPFLGWDVSQIIAAQNFWVDNDFEAYTPDGGSVLASVNLERVVYGVASPAPVPEPATMLLFGTGLAGLVGTRFRRKKK